MAAARKIDWIRRYSLCFVLCFVILGIQVYLACKLFPTDTNDGGSTGERRESLGKSPVLEDDGVSSRKFQNGFLSDDEDIGNSNQVPHKNREKLPPDKPAAPSAQKNNRTAELRLEELDFVPMCEITGREAVSAIHRARTQLCKQELANISCLNTQGKLYPERLHSLCPFPGIVPGKPLGCFQDEKKYRVLNGYYAAFKQSNSPAQCINLCYQSGFVYAGVEYSYECFCGNDEPPTAARLPDSSCNMPCISDPHKACGGFYTINVFKTGLAKIKSPPIRTTPLNSSEPRARVAFLLTLNGRASRQVRRLIRVLFHSDHFFYIHVDARQDYLFRELLPLEYQLSGRVKVARHRLATIWGGSSLLQILLSSMKELLNLHHEWPWDFIINLSESDFPLKSNEQLVQFLTSNKERNFVKSFGKDVQRFMQKQGLDKTFHECENHMWRVGDRTLPSGIHMDGGSDWVALAYPFVKYVAGGKDDKMLSGLKQVFKHTLLPAESFFHTVLQNSHLCATYVDNNLHVTNWKRKMGCRCQYKHVVDWCGCSPNDFKPSDWPKLQATEDREVFFGRKFEPVVSQSIIKLLEEYLYGYLPPDTPGLDSYWQSSFHYADLSPPSDDALVTLMHSLARLSARSLCALKINEILELTSYHHEDTYLGSLVKFEVKNYKKGSSVEIGETIMLESWVKARSSLTILDRDSVLAARIKGLYVSSEFDAKEEIARNFLGALGPFSQPVGVLDVGAGVAVAGGINATVLWLDPVGWLADVSEVHIDEKSQVVNSTPNIKTPLRPGVWMVKLVIDTKPLAQAHFLICPLEIMSNVEISSLQAEFLHLGPRHPYSSVSNSAFSALIPDPYGTNANTLLRKATINARRSGKDLRDWIDSLVARFYTVAATCVAGGKRLSNDCPNLDPCVKMPWSSLSPDPKSEIGLVNITSGRLN